MKFPRYWAKGETDELTRRNLRTGRVEGSFRCWGWSDHSVEEARAVGRQRAQRVARRIRAGEKPDRYGYGAPFREQVLDRWTDSASGDEEPWAIVSRNAYGCRILNTSSVFFADLDAPTPISPGFWRGILQLLGLIDQAPSPGRSDWEAEAMTRIVEFARSRGEGGIRVYRTHGGFRCLFTHRHADPESQSTVELLGQLGSDPLYVRLCSKRGCFRARLNPKPWRCGFRALDVDFPWTSQDEVALVDAWIARYRAASSRFATCELVDVLGGDATNSRIARVVQFHDQETGVGSGLPLA